ncbi:TlpA family protein disulfide reductase (plasmid) [Acinetobacter radioresistens]|jgi:thiol-disulfide isomerase/thioredoxin|uniref:TlpA disulfide reductase family protein n=1 Tax=Acinetobacter TaxID=469 RepID=UPI000451638E|nr:MULTISPECIES: TlpA disulfide reductase family protein [Acinetobacter]EXB26587.1 prolipodiacylglyceryl transferase family protein [Acinetobacter baumannii 1419130]NOJ68077.1 TlpA family protein disulfide reductase [Acinetobacter indicus]QCS13754.1 TlpA family protein disulfide reductase [Acinetobacter radioresistens]HEM7310913.1 TlpA family protein disulfide reductase [Acinetobacter baumannii]
MISSEALHLGPLMLPWGLLILLVALLITAMIGRKVGQQPQWSADIQQRFQDSIWSSVWVGLVGARLVFIGLNLESYWASPIDILKIQDKGFNLIGGVVIGSAWFWWRNSAIATKAKAILLLIFVMLLGTGLITQNLMNKEAHYPGLSFPSLNLSDQNQSQIIALQQFQGQPTVVNLWASWCPPCHREMPVLQRAHDQHPDVNFVMLNQGEDVDTVRAYLTKNQFSFKHVLLDAQGEMPQALNSFGIPTTLFFNAQGQLVERHQGELSQAMLQQYLKKINP